MLVWRELEPNARALLAGKLLGLYGGTNEEQIFDALARDKQYTLLIFALRLDELELWSEVLSLTNVYGEGGVGIEFVATRGLKRRLNREPRFTSRFATHRGTAEGFFELRRSAAALHFLRMKRGARAWSAHFDLYAPMNLLGALRHLWFERVRGHTPGWEEIASALGYDLRERVLTRPVNSVAHGDGRSG